MALTPSQKSLYWLAVWLRMRNYTFVTVTPETHRRVLAQRGEAPAESLRDVFGWNLPFALDLLPAEVMGWLQAADAVTTLPQGMARSRVRFASLDGVPYVHSAYPTTQDDAVFCGPDTLRFASLVTREIERDHRVARIVDVGCGAGAGGLIAGRRAQEATGRAPHITLVDVNPKAIELAMVNAATFGRADVLFHQSDLYSGITGGVDLIVANPPYLVDEDERLYRHGGGPFGSALSVRIVEEGLPLLAPGGRLVLYTGSAIKAGRDLFEEAAMRLVDPSRHEATYQELDPDVFGEELERPAYRGVERIAAVGLVIRRRSEQASGRGEIPADGPQGAN